MSQSFNDDGILLKGLKATLNNSINGITNVWKPSTIARCFPSVSEKNLSVLDLSRKYILEDIEKHWHEDFDEIFMDEFGDSLNKLSSYIKNDTTSQNVTAWRPSGNPVEDLRSHNYKVMQYEKKKLEQYLKEVQAKRDAAFTKLNRKRTEHQNNHLEILKYREQLQTVTNISDCLPNIGKSQ